MMMSEATVRAEWESLYDLLTETMKRYGRESWLGDGDYWIVDDFSEFEHKIFITNWGIFNRGMFTELQNILKNQFPMWRIKLQVEAPSIDRIVGVALRASVIEYHFNQEDLPVEVQRQIFP
jgi:hypothetical protein